MNKKIIGVFASFLVLAMIALPMSTVSGNKPTTITGTWRAAGGTQISPTKIAGANKFTYFQVTGEYLTGPLEGDFIHNITTTTHYGEPEQLPPAKFSWKMERIFTGSVNDNQGTLLIHLRAKGIRGGAPGTLKGTWVIISGTDDLANLHGRGTFTNLGGGQFSYEGQIHFEPAQ